MKTLGKILLCIVILSCGAILSSIIRHAAGSGISPVLPIFISTILVAYIFFRKNKDVHK